MKISQRARVSLIRSGYSVEPGKPITQLAVFAAQNSGIEPGNYFNLQDFRDGRKQKYLDGYKAFTQEVRAISADWRRFKDALTLAGAEGVTDKEVLASAQSAFGGRLEWRDDHWVYCTGQYFPTEYRKAAATVLEDAVRACRRTRPPQSGKVDSIAELKALNERNGGCWFGKGEMRFFGTRIESGIIRGKYFITSELPPNGSRMFTIRSFDEKGEIDSAGDFCQHKTKRDAMEALTEHCKKVNP